MTGLRVAAFFSAEDRSLFLRFADKDHAVGLIEVAEPFGHHVILALSFLELDERDFVFLGKAFGCLHEAFGHGAHQHRGSDGLTSMTVKKLYYAAFVLQLGDVDIEIHTVN